MIWYCQVFQNLYFLHEGEAEAIVKIAEAKADAIKQVAVAITKEVCLILWYIPAIRTYKCTWLSISHLFIQFEVIDMVVF